VEALGRLFNVIPIAAGVAVNLKEWGAVTFVCTGNDTFTLTSSDAFAGSYASPGNIITRKYTNAQTNGTAAWVEATQAASNAVTIASGTVVIHVDASQLPDGHAFLKCAAGAAGLVKAIVHDSHRPRRPSTYAALSA
jgi:hypothetical protein